LKFAKPRATPEETDPYGPDAATIHQVQLKELQYMPKKKITADTRTALLLWDRWQRVRRHPQYISFCEAKGLTEPNDLLIPNDPESEAVAERFKVDTIWSPPTDFTPGDMEHNSFFTFTDVEVIYPDAPVAVQTEEDGTATEWWSPIHPDQTLLLRVDVSGMSTKAAILAEVDALLDVHLPKVTGRLRADPQRWQIYDLRQQGVPSVEIIEMLGLKGDESSVHRCYRQTQARITEV
jgi:hypothetical protein